MLRATRYTWLRRDELAWLRGTDSPTCVQVRRPALCQGLSREKPRRQLRPHIRQGQWKGHNACYSGQSDWYRRNHHFASRCTQDQAADKPRGFPGTWAVPDRGRRRLRLVPWLGLDSRAQCARLIRGKGSSTFAVIKTDAEQLFGGSAAAKEYLYKLNDYNAASWSQNFVASIAGASASLIVSAPLDVIKTRIQNKNFDNPESGFRIVSNMMRHEGFTSFFKGLTPKLLMTGPKLVFSFWLAQTLIPAFNKVL